MTVPVLAPGLRTRPGVRPRQRGDCDPAHHGGGAARWRRVGARHRAGTGRAGRGHRRRLGGKRIQTDDGRASRPEVAAGFAPHAYARLTAMLFALPYFLLRRVPWTGVENVSFHRAEGWGTVRQPAFRRLPDDPAADRPEARIVRDGEALRVAVREVATDHLGPLLNGFQPSVRRGPRAVGDRDRPAHGVAVATRSTAGRGGARGGRGRAAAPRGHRPVHRRRVVPGPGRPGR